MLHFRHVVFAPLVAATVFGMAGCTPAMQAATDTFRVAISGQPPLVWTREQTQALPYAHMRLDSELGSAIMVLGRVVDGQRFWAAPGGFVLVEAHGLVRRVSGFTDSLENSRFIGTDPFIKGLHRLADGTTAERIVDWMPAYRYGITLHSQFVLRGSDSIDILGQRIEVLYVEEHLRATNVDFQATNRYWLSPVDGTILKSEQQITPTLRFNLTTLRPVPTGAGS